MPTTNGVQVNASLLMTVKELSGATLSDIALVRHSALPPTAFTTNGWTPKEKECVLLLPRKKTAEAKDTAIGKADVLDRAIAHLTHTFRWHQTRPSNQFATKFQPSTLITFNVRCVRHVQKLTCTQRKETFVNISALMVNALSNSKLRIRSRPV